MLRSVHVFFLAGSLPARSFPVRPFPARPFPVRPFPIRPFPIRSFPVRSVHIWPEQNTQPIRVPPFLYARTHFHFTSPRGSNHGAAGPSPPGA